MTRAFRRSSVPVGRQKPVFVQMPLSSASRPIKPIKWALPGPMTMIDTLADRYYGSREKLAWEFAGNPEPGGERARGGGRRHHPVRRTRLQRVLRRRARLGCRDARARHRGLRAETVVHICYGYGIKANTDWKATLAPSGASTSTRSRCCRDRASTRVAGVAQLPHSARRHRAPARQEDHARCVDVASHEIERPEEVADTLRRALEFVDADKLIASSNCGMAPLPRDVALAKLSALSAGAAILREELAGALV